MRKRRPLLVLLLAALLLGAAAVGGWYLIPSPPRVRAFVLHELRAVLGDAVFVDHAAFRIPGTIRVEGIRIGDPDRPEEGGPLLLTDLVIEAGWFRALFGGPLFRHLRLVRPTLRLHRDASGVWNLMRLLTGVRSGRPPGSVPPFITISDGTALVAVPRSGRGREILQIHEIELSVGRARGGDGSWTVAGTALMPPATRVALRGRLTAGLEIQGIELMASRVALTPEPPFPCPEQVEALWRALRPSGDAGVTVRIGETQRSGEPAPEGVELVLNGVDLDPPGLGIPLRDLRGKASFGFDALVDLDLEGKEGGGGAIAAQGRIESAFTDPALEITLAARNVPLGGAWTGLLERFVPGIRDALRAAGWVTSCGLHLRGPLTGPHGPSVEFRAEVRDFEATYAGFAPGERGERVGFPYPVRALAGSVEKHGDTIRIRLAGTHRPPDRDPGGSGGDGGGTAPDLWIDGWILTRGKGPGIQLRLRATDLPLDARLREALPPEARRTWDRLHPGGRADAIAWISHGGMPESSTRVDVDADLQDASLRYDGFPYPVEGIQGHLRIRGSAVGFESLTGRHGDIRVEGRGFLARGADARRDELRITAVGVPLDDELFAPLRQAGLPADEVLEELRPEGGGGRIDVEYYQGRIPGAPDGGDPAARIRVHGVTLRPTRIPFPLEDLEGTVVASRTGVSIEGLKGTALGASVTLTGSVATGEDPPRVTLDVGAGGVRLEGGVRDALAALHEEATGIWEALEPRGAVDLQCRVESGPGGLAVRARFSPRGDCSIVAPYAPERITGLTGEISFEPDGIRCRGLRGNMDTAVLHASGHYIPRTTEGMPVRITLQASGLRLSREAFRNLPAGLRRALASIKLEGVADIPVLVLQNDTRTEGSPWWVEGQVSLHRAALFDGDVVRDLEADLSLDPSSLGPEDFRLTGRLVEGSAKVAGQPLEGIFCKVEVEPDQVRVGDLAASVYGGLLYGKDSHLTVDTTSPPTFHGEIHIGGVKLREYCALHAPRSRTLRGSVECRARFDGAGLDVLDLRAKGRIEVTDARLFEVPIIRSILQALPLRRPPVFTRAGSDFSLRRGIVKLDDIEMYSGPLSLDGKGSVDLDGTVDLVLFPRIAPDLPSIFLVSDLWGLVQNQLLAFRVTGPIDRPRTEVQNVVTALLGPRRRSRGRPIPPPFPPPPRPARF